MVLFHGSKKTGTDAYLLATKTRKLDTLKKLQLLHYNIFYIHAHPTPGLCAWKQNDVQNVGATTPSKVFKGA